MVSTMLGTDDSKMNKRHTWPQRAVFLVSGDKREHWCAIRHYGCYGRWVVGNYGDKRENNLVVFGKAGDSLYSLQ